jgi:hypothetical protein
MRGWKPINFEQFSWNCNDRMYDKNERSRCRVLDSNLEIDCCPSFCPEWRKLGRADIKVIKVKSHNSSTTPAPKRPSAD